MSFAPRNIDHVVLASRSLSGEVELYRRLGFQVGVRNRHPFGTENHIIQFDGSFLELISAGQGFIRPPDSVKFRFSFPVFVFDYLKRREGMAMLALGTRDAVADRAEFIKNGIGEFETFHFERRARRPDGSEAMVAFTLAYAQSKLMTDAGFFTCQQHYPASFWNPCFQDHPNGATGLSGVVMVAENPADHAEFLSHLTDQREMHSTSLGIELSLAGGQKLEVLTEAGYSFRYGQPAPESAAASFAAVRIKVRDLETARRVMLEGAIAAIERPGMLIVPQEIADGVMLVFEKDENSAA